MNRRIRTPAPGVVIGREGQKSVLTSSLEAATTGKRACVLLGPPGAGKTALMQWSFIQAQEQNLLTASVRVPASAGLPPRFPIGDLLSGVRDSLVRLGFDVPDALTGVLGTLTGATSEKEYPAAVPQITQAFSLAAERAPLALFIDDYQWMPKTAAEQLMSALRAMDGGAFLCATARFRNLENDQWRIPEPTGDMWVSTMEIGPLDEAETGALISFALGGRGSPELITHVWHHAGGNPLYILELLQWLVASGTTSLVNESWALESSTPISQPTLRGHIESQLMQLSPSLFRFCLLLAMFDRPVTWGELKSLMPNDSPQRSATQMQDLGFTGFDSTACWVVHPVYVEAARSIATNDELSALHQVIFETLGDSIPLSEAAYHASRSQVPPRGLDDLLHRAALEAESRGATQEAVEIYRELLTHPQLSDRSRAAITDRLAFCLLHIDPAVSLALLDSRIADSMANEDRVALLLGRSDAQRFTGQLTLAMGDLEEASALSKAPTFEVEYRRAVLAGAMGQPGQALRALQDLLPHCLQPTERQQVQARLGQALLTTGQLIEAHDAWIELLPTADDPTLIEYLNSNAAWSAILLGRWTEADRHLAVAFKQAKAAGDLWALQSIHSSAAKLAALRGDASLAFEHAGAGDRLARRLQHPVAELEALESQGIAMLAAGRPSDALTPLLRATALIDETTEVRDPVVTLCALGYAFLRTGNHEGARESASSARAHVKTQPFYSAMIENLEASTAIKLRDFALATTHLRDATSTPLKFELMRTWLLKSEIQAATGNAAESRASEQVALDLAIKLGIPSLASRLGRPRRGGRGRPRVRRPLGITDREFEVLSLISKGHAATDIARKLFISRETVKKHRQNGFKKLGLVAGDDPTALLNTYFLPLSEE